MIDHCLAYGDDCINKVKEETEKKRTAALKIIEKHIQQNENTDGEAISLKSNLVSDGMSTFEKSPIELDDALLSREWRIVSWAIGNVANIADGLGISMDEDEEEKKEAGEDKVAAMQTKVNLKGNDKDKTEEWIS